MDKIGKTFVIFLTLTVAMSCLTLLVANPANAQTIPNPSVPEFTVKYVDKSYTVPATSTIDPFTGQNVTSPSRYIENRTLELAIRNQPFTSYVDNSTGAPWKITLMYQIRWKGHFEQNWTNIYSVDNGFLSAINSDYTAVSYSLGECPIWDNPVNGGTVDFQVEAMIGYVSRTVGFASWYFTGQSSDWSPTHEVTVPASNVLTNPTISSSPSPTVPESSLLALVPLMVSILSIAVVLRHRKTANLSKLDGSAMMAHPHPTFCV